MRSRDHGGVGLTVDVVGDDSVCLEAGVQLVAHAVDDDGVEPDAVQKVEREGERLEVVGEDGAADFEDGKVGGRGKDLQVPRHFAAGGERVQQPDDGFLGVQCVRVSQPYDSSPGSCPRIRQSGAESSFAISGEEGTDPVCVGSGCDGTSEPALCHQVTELIAGGLLLSLHAAVGSEERRRVGGGRREGRDLSASGGREGEPASLCG